MLRVFAICFLGVVTASACSKRDTSANALCKQVGLVNAKQQSDSELPQDCEQRVERIRDLSSPEDFRTYAKCLWKAEQNSDLKDCHEPFKSDLHIWGKELEREIERAKLQADEAFGDLEAAKTDEEKQAAIAKRRAAIDAQKVAREKLRRLQFGIGGPLAPPLSAKPDSSRIPRF